MDRHWRLRDVDEASVEGLQRELGIGRLLAGILVGRGFSDPGEVDRLLNPRLGSLEDPFAIEGMSSVVERILIALHARERICIFSDYDVDGLTSNALLHWVLKALDGAVSSFVPQRHEEGYGMTPEAVARCVATERPELLIAVDCGTHAVDVVRDLMDHGMDVVVIDHHAGATGTRQRPSPFFINPHFVAGQGTAGAGLASVGLCFKLAHALMKRLRMEGGQTSDRFDLRAVLPWVALGTVADLVPLLGENRVLVTGGIRHWELAPGAGLAALGEIAGVNGQVRASDLGFGLGPRINAAGRMSDPRMALDLLLSVEVDSAREQAKRLDLLNQERKSVEQAVFEEAVRQWEDGARGSDSRFIVVSGEGWHEGVLGIVASRLVRRFHRPCLVVSRSGEGEAKGSARSVPGIDLVSAMACVRPLLTRLGGHPQAAGFSLACAEIERIGPLLDAYVREHVALDTMDRVHEVDAELDLGDVNAGLIQELELLEPCGMGMRRPLLMARGVALEGPPRGFGNGHVRMHLLRNGAGPLEAVGFGMADLPLYPVMDILFELEWNQWRGKSGPRMLLQGLRPEANGSPKAT
ncbi:MAG: single-stranded-DNA-specific exonuclease RecJ [Verrucomicrobiota bacterium]|jgi:single-stranded-DNA-specific exonuclease